MPASGIDFREWLEKVGYVKIYNRHYESDSESVERKFTNNQKREIGMTFYPHAEYCTRVNSFDAQVNALPVIPTLMAVEQLLSLISENFDVSVVAAIFAHAEATSGGGWREILVQLGAQADKVFPNQVVANVARGVLAFCAFFLKIPSSVPST